MLSNIVCYEREQTLPISSEDCWSFFSDPQNLPVITPPWLGFEVLTDATTIYPGQILQYDVRPLLGIKVRWVTEITQVTPGEFFIDEQRFGPYRFWHHRHHFHVLTQRLPWHSSQGS